MVERWCGIEGSTAGVTGSFSFSDIELGLRFWVSFGGILVVCVILYFYPATCGPKGHGSGSAAA